MRALLLVVALAGCNGRWIDTHATQIHVGTLEAEIPPHWRDMNELRDKPTVSLPPGTRVIMYDTGRADSSGEIMVSPMGSMVVTGDNCQTLVELWKPQIPSGIEINSVESATFKDSPGCKMHIHMDRGVMGTISTFTRAKTTVMVRCVGTAYQEVEYACDKILYGLHETPTK